MNGYFLVLVGDAVFRSMREPILFGWTQLYKEVMQFSGEDAILRGRRVAN